MQPDIFDQRNTKYLKINMFESDENSFNNSNVLSVYFNRSDANSIKIKFVLNDNEGDSNYTQILVHSGEFFLMNRDQRFSYKLCSGSSLNNIYLIIDNNLLRGAFKMIKSKDVLLLDTSFDKIAELIMISEVSYNITDIKSGEELKHFISSINLETKEVKASPDKLICMVAEALIKVYMDYEKILNKLSGLKTETKDEMAKKLLKSKFLLDAQLFNSVNIKKIAKEVGLSEFYFYRSFKMAFGKSPYQYYMHKKIEKVAEVFKSKNKNFSELAFLFGFPNKYVLVKIFKKKYGTYIDKYQQSY